MYLFKSIRNFILSAANVVNKKSVTKSDFRNLKLYNDHLINDHLNADDDSFNRLIKQRGQLFLNTIRDNDLNRFETLIISGYADFIATNLNNNLRSLFSYRSDSYNYYEVLLNRSLNKMVPYNNSTVYVMYTSNGNRDKLIQWYSLRINETVQFPNFLSSSRRNWEDRDLYLQIKTANKSSGKHIAHLTDKPELEDEVLFKSNTKFMIISVDESIDTIFLEEINIPQSANYILFESYESNIDNKENVDRLKI